MNGLVKKLVLAWDPDFTKLTPSEAKRLDEAQKEIENGEYITHEELMRELDLKWKTNNPTSFLRWVVFTFYAGI